MHASASRWCALLAIAMVAPVAGCMSPDGPTEASPVSLTPSLSFVSTGSGQNRTGHVAVALGNGQVLVAGGSLALSPEDAEIVHGLVHKPFDIDLMLNAVREALGDPVVEVEPRQYDAQDHFLHGY